eukprot:750609-Hanusia_phi.AAC.6
MRRVRAGGQGTQCPVVDSNGHNDVERNPSPNLSIEYLNVESSLCSFKVPVKRVNVVHQGIAQRRTFSVFSFPLVDKDSASSQVTRVSLYLRKCFPFYPLSMNLHALWFLLGVSATLPVNAHGLILRGGNQEFHGLVKKTIDLRLGGPVKRCEIRGNWNDWRPIEMELADPAQRIWRKELSLPPGEYQVSRVALERPADSRASSSESRAKASEQVSDGCEQRDHDGMENNVLVVEASRIELESEQPVPRVIYSSDWCEQEQEQQDVQEQEQEQQGEQAQAQEQEQKVEELVRAAAAGEDGETPSSVYFHDSPAQEKSAERENLPVAREPVTHPEAARAEGDAAECEEDPELDDESAQKASHLTEQLEKIIIRAQEARELAIARANAR